MTKLLALLVEVDVKLGAEVVMTSVEDEPTLVGAPDRVVCKISSPPRAVGFGADFDSEVGGELTLSSVVGATT